MKGSMFTLSTNAPSAPVVPVSDREPEPDAYPCFLIGRNGRGQWIVLETHGGGGGFFASREAALHYAAFESDRQPGAVRFAAEPFEFRF
jgi:hypothetical protein